MNNSQLADKLVAILGFGSEGMAVAKYLLKHGVSPVIFDKRPAEAFSESALEFLKEKKLRFVLGEDYLSEFSSFDVVFRSPGFYRLDPVLLDQEKKGLLVTSQTKFFFENCPAKIIGVTGTKGKGTTASLTYLCFKAGYEKGKVYLTGNIGKIAPLDFLDDLSSNDVVIYELSSFQLQDLDRSPNIGVVLMVTEEHLDVHKNVEEYIEAKSSIVKFQETTDFSIFSADFPASLKLGQLGLGMKLAFSRKNKVAAGLFYNGQEILSIGLEKAFGIKDNTVIVEKNKLQLRGEHNIENISAGALCAIAGSVEISSIKSSIESFTGLEHRLELVCERKGIKFYNDSFATTPESSIAAIKSFSEPLVLILGGSEKHSDYSKMGKIISQQSNIKAIILIGVTAAKIEESLKQSKNSAPVMVGAKNMEEIFIQISKVAKEGDVVLLSPACASFDMFKNYEDRGNQFKAAAVNFQ